MGSPSSLDVRRLLPNHGEAIAARGEQTPDRGGRQNMSVALGLPGRGWAPLCRGLLLLSCLSLLRPYSIAASAGKASAQFSN